MKKFFSKKIAADQDIEQLIGLQLRYGVIVSSLIVLAGGLCYIYQSGGSAVPHYQSFTGAKSGLLTFSEILKGVRAFNAAAIIELGVMVLVATPILRIVFSLFGFILEKDKLYTVITLTVLAVMMISIFGGLKI